MNNFDFCIDLDAKRKKRKTMGIILNGRSIAINPIPLVNQIEDLNNTEDLSETEQMLLLVKTIVSKEDYEYLLENVDMFDLIDMFADIMENLQEVVKTSIENDLK